MPLGGNCTLVVLCYGWFRSAEEIRLMLTFRGGSKSTPIEVADDPFVETASVTVRDGPSHSQGGPNSDSLAGQPRSTRYARNPFSDSRPSAMQESIEEFTGPYKETH